MSLFAKGGASTYAPATPQACARPMAGSDRPLEHKNSGD